MRPWARFIIDSCRCFRCQFTNRATTAKQTTLLPLPTSILGTLWRWDPAHRLVRAICRTYPHRCKPLPAVSCPANSIRSTCNVVILPVRARFRRLSMVTHSSRKRKCKRTCMRTRMRTHTRKLRLREVTAHPSYIPSRTPLLTCVLTPCIPILSLLQPCSRINHPQPHTRRMQCQYQPQCRLPLCFTNRIILRIPTCRTRLPLLCHHHSMCPSHSHSHTHSHSRHQLVCTLACSCTLRHRTVNHPTHRGE